MLRLSGLMAACLLLLPFGGSALLAETYPSLLVPEPLQLAHRQQQQLQGKKVVRRVKAGLAEFVEHSYRDKLVSECLQGREPRTVSILDARGRRYDHAATYETLSRAEFPFPGAVITRSEGVCTHGPAFGGFVYLADKDNVYRFSWPAGREQAACGEDYHPGIEIRHDARARALLMVREERPDCAAYSEVPAIAVVEYLVVEPGEKLVFRRFTEQSLPADLRARWAKLRVYRGQGR